MSLGPQEKEQLEQWFGERATSPSEEELAARANIAVAAYRFGAEIMRLCSASADRSAALRQLRECLWTSTAALRCEPGAGDKRP
jgi:hypothetical protein